MRLRWILLSTLMAAVVLVPRMADAYINAGFKSQAEADAYYKRQRDVKSREAAQRLAVLDEAIQRDPNDAVAYYQRAKFHSQRSPKLAVTDFDAALRLNPKFAQALFRRSCVRASLKDYVGCASDLEETLCLDSTSADARFRLASLCYASPDESLRDLAKSRRLAESLCDANKKPEQRHLELLAAVCAELGDFEAAIRWETKLWESTPDAIPPDSRLHAYRRGETVMTLRNQMSSVPANIPLD